MAVFSGVGLGRSKANPEKEIVDLLRNIPGNPYKKKQIEALKAYMNKECTEEEALSKINALIKEYSEMTAASSGREQYLRLSRGPYTGSELKKIMGNEQALKLAIDISDTMDFALEVTSQKFGPFFEYRRKFFEDCSKYKIDGDKSLQSIESALMNEYYSLITELPKHQLQRTNPDATLKMFEKMVAEFRSNIQEMAQAAQTVYKNPESKTVLNNDSLIRSYNMYCSLNNPKMQDLYAPYHIRKLMKNIEVGEQFVEQAYGESQRAYEDRLEEEYKTKDASDLIALYEKMNHNPRNIAQVKAFRDSRRAGLEVDIPEGDFTQEQLEQFLECPTTREITDMLIEANEKAQDVHARLEKYPDRSKLPVELSPYEDLEEVLEYVYRQHITTMAGPETAKRCFGSLEKAMEIYSHPKLISSCMALFPQTVDHLDDVGNFGCKGTMTLPYYKTIVDSYCRQVGLEVESRQADKESERIENMPRKERKSLAELVSMNRTLKARKAQEYEMLKQEQKSTEQK